MTFFPLCANSKKVVAIFTLTNKNLPTVAALINYFLMIGLVSVLMTMIVQVLLLAGDFLVAMMIDDSSSSSSSSPPFFVSAHTGGYATVAR
jgi:hypothetical protein